MKLFSEAVEDVEYITEAKEGGGKDYKIRGIFMQADIKNRNGRVYPMEMVEMKREFDVKQRQRNANKEALAFAKFLKRL
jgi:hypothetical protein